MKRLSVIAVVFFTTIISYGMKAENNYILKIITGNGKIMKFRLNSSEKSIFSIYDENNNLVYLGESGVDKLETSKTITLEGYASGTYFLEVKEGSASVRHEIKVYAKKRKLVKLDKTVNYSPSFRR